MTSTAPLTDGPVNRRAETDVRVFTASPQFVADLQRVLVDLIELHLQGKQAHWNVVGTNFRDLHLQLDELVDAAREASDTVAERLRAVDAVPDGRSDTAWTVRAVSTAARGEHELDAVDVEDPTTTDLLLEIIDSLEKLAWLIKSENRKPLVPSNTW